jgi:hypothetical protein
VRFDLLLQRCNLLLGYVDGVRCARYIELHDEQVFGLPNSFYHLFSVATGCNHLMVGDQQDDKATGNAAGRNAPDTDDKDDQPDRGRVPRLAWRNGVKIRSDSQLRGEQADETFRGHIILDEEQARERQSLTGNRRLDGQRSLVEADVLGRSRCSLRERPVEELRPEIMGIVEQEIADEFHVGRQPEVQVPRDDLKDAKAVEGGNAPDAVFPAIVFLLDHET